MENVELVPAICPKCGANLQLPENLTKAHCIYCGNAFIISEKKPDVHYHMGEQVGTIENYAKLMIDALKRADQAEAKKYWLKAKEINIEEAEIVFKKYGKEICEAYLLVADHLIREMLETPPYDLNAYSIDLDLQPLGQASKNVSIAIGNAASFYPDHVDVSLYYGLWLMEYGKMAGPDKQGNWDKAASWFHKVLEKEPDNKIAITGLKTMGIKCKKCKGTGQCLYCEGTNECDCCDGTGKCDKCNGTGLSSGLFSKGKPCKTCGGSGTCPMCDGKKTCVHCKGKITCTSCQGRGI